MEKLLVGQHFLQEVNGLKIKLIIFSMQNIKHYNIINTNIKFLMNKNILFSIYKYYYIILNK